MYTKILGTTLLFMIFDNYFHEYREKLMLQELIVVKCTFSKIKSTFHKYQRNTGTSIPKTCKTYSKFPQPNFGTCKNEGVWGSI